MKRVDSKIHCLKQMIDVYDEHKTTILDIQEVSREKTISKKF